MKTSFQMKKILPALMIVLSAWCGAGAAEIVSALKPDRDTLAAAARVKLVAPYHLVFVGDSLTAMAPQTNYVAIIRAALQAQVGTEASVTNAGVNGDSITRVLARLDKDVVTLQPKPTHVFIFVGHNDSKLSSASGYKEAFVPPGDFDRDYRAVISRIQQKLGAKVIVVSATSSNYAVTKSIADGRKQAGKEHNLFGQPQSLEAFNALARQAAQDLSADYVDLYNPTRTFRDKNAFFIKDGVHTSELGNRFIAIELLKYLATLK